MFNVSKAEHTSYKDPTLKLHVMEEEEGGGATGFLSSSKHKLRNIHGRWLVYMSVHTYQQRNIEVGL